MKRLLYIIIILLSPLTLKAQIASPGTPASNELNWSTDVPEYIMPGVDMAQIALEDSIDDLRGRPMRFGKGHDVEFSSLKHGKWEMTNDGRRVWRIKFKCPEALSVNLIYQSFNLPEGGRLYVYNEDKSYILGAFTAENKMEDGTFSTGLVPGEVTYVEYNAPESSPEPNIVISRVVHGYRNFFNFNKLFGDSGPCNNNVNCPEGLPWTDQINSIAMIVLGNGTRWCSGAMINNTCEDGSPYFLTANHCLTGSVTNWLFYFNYQSDSCVNIDGPTNQIVAGSRLISTSSSSDFALLELSSRPPAIYNAFYSGWSNINTPTDTAVGIHHPSGDIKKISFSNQQIQSTLYLANTQDTSFTHWRVPTWDDGTTEGGSSGSPLYNTEKQIVGQLHGGFASCNNITSDWYGKFSYSWDQGNTPESRLSNWLDPSQAGSDTMNGGYFNIPAPLEAAISSVEIPERSCFFTQIPELRISNKGLDTIQSIEIAWSVSGVLQDTLLWNGQILPGSSNAIVLDTLSLSPGNFWLSAEILLVNGQTDLNTCNNLKSRDFEIISGREVMLRLRTDNWPEEVSVLVEDTTGNTIYALSNFMANALDTFYFCLEPDCYNITVFDSYGDGLTAGGFYEFSIDDSVLFFGSGAFGNCTGSFMTNGCSVEHSLCLDTVSLDQSPTAGFLISDTLYTIGDTILVNDNSSNIPTSWDWRFVNDSMTYTSTSQNPTLIPSFTGWYGVELIAANSFGSDTLRMDSVFRVERFIALTQTQNFENISVYPNPAEDLIYVDMNSDIPESISIYAISGSLIFSKNDFDERQIEVDVSGIYNGMYLLEIKTSESAYRQRIILK